MYIKHNTGQSTVEYVLLMTAVVAVIILMVTQPNTGLQGQLTNTINSAIGQVDTMSTRLAGSEPASAPSNFQSNYTVNPD